ncbi:unnamed protein product [Mytilus coruscus]|uniref:Uncharacterized protein n=1 Tax=Mytilus coruscus TaxID=42192 RepID=A0A6J8E461_MYTCO|nr:unnamed protein product [Mytilus coruscus]
MNICKDSAMDINKIVILVLFTILEQTFADPAWCRVIIDKKDSYRKYCYNEDTYRNCKNSCVSVVLDPNYIANDCPWGDAHMARGCNKINNLTSGRYCMRKTGSKILTEDVVIGINCCGTCMTSNLKQSPDKPEEKHAQTSSLSLAALQTVSTKSNQGTYSNAKPTMENLDVEVEKLVNFVRKIHGKLTRSLEKFSKEYDLNVSWPVQIDVLTRFIAYLSYSGLTSSTITTYLSGISHKHKLLGVIDTTCTFIVSKMLEGVRKKSPKYQIFALLLL